MEAITVSPLALIALGIIAAVAFAIVWHKERSKVEAKTIDVLHAVIEDAVASIDRIVAADRSAVSRAQANLLASQAHADAARQALAALTAPKS